MSFRRKGLRRSRSPTVPDRACSTLLGRISISSLTGIEWSRFGRGKTLRFASFPACFGQMIFLLSITRAYFRRGSTGAGAAFAPNP
jgi:hypothetical protein